MSKFKMKEALMNFLIVRKITFSFVMEIFAKFKHF